MHLHIYICILLDVSGCSVDFRRCAVAEKLQLWRTLMSHGYCPHIKSQMSPNNVHAAGIYESEIFFFFNSIHTHILYIVHLISDPVRNRLSE